MNDSIKILDVVALLVEKKDLNLAAGQVGTVIEKLDDETFEVEFTGSNGVTIALVAVKSKDLLVLHYEAEQV